MLLQVERVAALENRPGNPLQPSRLVRDVKGCSFHEKNLLNIRSHAILVSFRTQFPRKKKKCKGERECEVRLKVKKYRQGDEEVRLGKE
jgi:hypothetical protein